MYDLRLTQLIESGNSLPVRDWDSKEALVVDLCRGLMWNR